MKSSVGSAHCDQKAADHTVCVAMDEVVKSIGAMYIDAHEAVRLGEKLRNKLVHQLMNPGNIDYNESPLP